MPGLADKAEALTDEGSDLLDLDRLDDAIACFDEVVGLFGDGDDPEVRQHVARSFVLKGCALSQQSRGEDAITAFDDAVRHVGDAEAPSLRAQAMFARYNKADELRQMGRKDEVIEVLAELLNPYFVEAPPDGTMEILVDGALMSASVAMDLGQPQAAISLYDQVIERYVAETDEALREGVAKAMAGKAIILGRGGRTDDALAILVGLRRRVEGATDAVSRRRLAETLCSEGYWLQVAGRQHDALDAFAAVIDRFGDEADPEIAEQVAYAREMVEVESCD